jgi:diguanylate cyclase (GGDEF)-like protein
MGGDEFVVILGGSTTAAIASKSEQYRQVTRAAGLAFCGDDILSASVGAASFPEDGTDAEQLLAVADKRMYQAKQSRPRPAPETVDISTVKPVLVQ